MKTRETLITEGIIEIQNILLCLATTEGEYAGMLATSSLLAENVASIHAVYAERRHTILHELCDAVSALREVIV